MEKMRTDRANRWSSGMHHKQYGIQNYLRSRLKVHSEIMRMNLISDFLAEEGFASAKEGTDLINQQAAFIDARFQKFCCFCRKYLSNPINNPRA